MNEFKKDKKDFIIKVILIVIIILLLVHNCVTLNKKKKEKTPSGNVNIIEITCVDNDKCDVTDKDGNIVKNDNGNGSGDSIDINDSNNISGSSGISGSNSTNRNSSSSGSGSNSNSSSSSTESTTTDSTESDDEVLVSDNRIIWNDSSDLKIFSNSVYNFEDKIAPESSNTYQFVVKNSTSYKIKYSMSFIETNPYNINMKYRLKKNNNYIVDRYVSYNELNLDEQLLNAKKNDTFYLDWKWVSSDNDTDAGNNQANYSLKIDIKAESVNG